MLVFSSWVRFASRTSNFRQILTFGDTGLYCHKDDRVRAFVGGNWLISAPVTGTMGSWYHVFMVVDGLTSRLYINGALSSSGTAKPNTTIEVSAWETPDPMAGNSYDIGPAFIANTDIAEEDALQAAMDLSFPNPDYEYQSEFVPEFVPVVKIRSVKKNLSGLCTVEASHTVRPGRNRAKFPYKVADRRSKSVCHFLANDLNVGDPVSFPARFFEVAGSGEFNGETTLTVEPADELPTELPPVEDRIPLGGNADNPRYYSEGYEYGNDFQRLHDWKNDSTFAEDAVLDQETGIPVGDAVHHWSFGARSAEEGYYIYWQGSGELSLSFRDEHNAGDNFGVDGEWKWKYYAPGFDRRIQKAGEVTAMKAQWESELANIDRNSSGAARERWKPYTTIRHSKSLAISPSSMENPEDLTGPNFLGGINNLITRCRLTNDLGIDYAMFSVPHLGTEAFMRKFFEQIRDHLYPSIKVIAEYSNEVWNTAGPYSGQTNYVLRLAEELGITFHEAYVAKSLQMERIGIEVLGDRYYKTMLAGQFGVASMSNLRYRLGLEAGIKRGCISNAIYFGPDLDFKSEETQDFLAECSAEQMVDLVRVSLDQDYASFNAIREHINEYPECECWAYEGGWSFSSPWINADNIEKLRKVAVEAPLHPKQVQLYQYAYRLAKDAGFSMFMHFSPDPQAWSIKDTSIKTWSDRNRWDQEAGMLPGQSPRAFAAVQWTSDNDVPPPPPPEPSPTVTITLPRESAITLRNLLDQSLTVESEIND